MKTTMMHHLKHIRIAFVKIQEISVDYSMDKKKYFSLIVETQISTDIKEIKTRTTKT
jgi:hypothetical protein